MVGVLRTAMATTDITAIIHTTTTGIWVGATVGAILTTGVGVIHTIRTITIITIHIVHRIIIRHTLARVVWATRDIITIVLVWLLVVTLAHHAQQIEVAR